MNKNKLSPLDRFSYFMTRNRLKIIILALIIAGIFSAGIVRIKGDVNLDDMLPYEHPYLQIIGKFTEVFGSGGGGVILSLETKNSDIYNKETLNRIIKMTDEIALWTETYRVLTLSIGARSVKVAKALPGGEIAASTLMWPEAPDTEKEIDDLKKNIYTSPLIRGLVAEQGTAAVLVTEFKLDVPYERAFGLLKEVQAKYSDGNISVKMAGFSGSYGLDLQL